MCTVTFLPTVENNFILTSSRDEHKERKLALAPRKYNVNGQSVFFPKDTQAGGTWIATSNNHFTLCLLNGAFQKHTPTGSYKLSRGLVLLDFFQFNNIEAFSSQYDFLGIEPFTLLIIDSSAGLQVHELIWDGIKLHQSQKDETKPSIWSSVTLYNAEVIAQREEWFKIWLAENKNYGLDQIRQFHQVGGTGNKTNDVLMSREDRMLTVSITSIRQSTEGIYMQYKDVQENKEVNIRIM